jgi:hypothetical protein
VAFRPRLTAGLAFSVLFAFYILLWGNKKNRGLPDFWEGKT